MLEVDGINFDDIIMDLVKVKEKGLIFIVIFLKGNIVFEGLVIKLIFIDLFVVGEDGVYCYIGKVKVFILEKVVIKLIKIGGIEVGDIMVVMGGGFLGIGMEEIY